MNEKYKQALEKMRVASEQKFDILITIIGMLLVIFNHKIGYLILAMLLISHYTSAKAALYGIHEHDKEAYRFDEATKWLNLFMLIIISIYSLYVLIFNWNN